MTMKLKFFISLVSLLLAAKTNAQQSDLQSKRPLVFSKPVPLNWQSVPFQSINYNLKSIDGGASLYSLPSKSVLKFSLKVVLPDSIFSLSPQERTSYGALSDLLILGGFGQLTFEQIQNFLSVNGINLNTYINQQGRIVLSANALSGDFDLVLGLIQQMLFSPKFDKSALDIWKQESNDDFTNLMDANTLEKQMRIVDNQANILALGENHYFSNSIKRTSPAEINKVTNEKIKQLYKRAFNRNGLSVWIAGNYSEKNFSSLQQLISQIPENLPQVYTWLPERTLTKKKDNKISTIILKKSDMTQANVTMRYYFSNFGQLNKIEEAQMMLISEIFSSTGGVVGNDRFTKAMRADSGISYSPHAYFNARVLFPNTNLSAFQLNFQSPNERLAEAVAIAKKTWSTFLSKGISQDELDVARTALMNRLLASEETIFNQSDDIMGQILRGKVPYNNPIEFTLVSLDQLRDVTKINSVLKMLESSNPLPTLVVMGNPDAKQLSLLTKESDINLLKELDFNAYVKSF